MLSCLNSRRKNKQYLRNLVLRPSFGELQEEVKVLVVKREKRVVKSENCWWKKGRFHLKTHTKLALDTCLIAPVPTL